MGGDESVGCRQLLECLSPALPPGKKTYLSSQSPMCRRGGRNEQLSLECSPRKGKVLETKLDGNMTSQNNV